MCWGSKYVHLVMLSLDFNYTSSWSVIFHRCNIITKSTDGMTIIHHLWRILCLGFMKLDLWPFEHKMVYWVASAMHNLHDLILTQPSSLWMHLATLRCHSHPPTAASMSSHISPIFYESVLQGVLWSSSNDLFICNTIYYASLPSVMSSLQFFH